MVQKLRVGVFHPGTQHSWQSAIAFQESGQLGWYATSVFYNSQHWPYRSERFLPSKVGDWLGREFRRRYTPLLDPGLVRTFGVDEWLETAARRLGWRRLSQRFNVRGNTRFADGVIRLIEREPVDVIWGYNSSSLEVFRWAKRRGLRCVLDQTIGHPRDYNRVISEEQIRHPDFFFNFGLPCDEDWIRKEDEEVALADIVVVSSEFCRQSMIDNGCPPEKIRIIPYGFDESLFPSTPPTRRPMLKRPIECLFVGSIDPRKGVAYLLEAFSDVPADRASLTLIGAMNVPAAAFNRYARRVKHVAQLPRPDVVKHFREADLFVFPSLFEGSALVLYEAVGAGLGIVQSKMSGTGVTANQDNGVMLKEVSVSSLKSSIDDIVERPAVLDQWHDAAWELRSERSWHTYRQRARKLLD